MLGAAPAPLTLAQAASALANSGTNLQGAASQQQQQQLPGNAVCVSAADGRTLRVTMHPRVC